ncbi:MAG TPA: ABC transporter permease subunit [Verrucomicrobiae bacterium]|nr:ABC transporter permease subunit [Verrucomicrobiae bacterium]
MRTRLMTAGSGVVVVCLFLLFSGLMGSRGPGSALHRILFFGGLYLSLLPALRISVGLFSDERRNQTLELLYLTGIGAWELFLGKLLGGLLVASSDLLALMPMLAVPFFSGGLSANLFVATIACWPALLLFTVAVGVVGSVLCREDGAAFVCAVVVGVVICVAVPLPYYCGIFTSGLAPFSARWLCLSPAYGAYLVGMNFYGGTVGRFWLATGVSLGWTLLCLGFAAVWLNGHWRDTEARDLAVGGWRGKWMGLTRGSVAWRARVRRRALAENAFQWLAEQDRRPVLLVWGFVGVLAGLWLVAWSAWPDFWGKPIGFYVTTAMALAGIGLVETYAAARAIGIERRQGSLELLLTTSLTPEDVVEGQVAATRAQFRPVRTAMLGLCVAMTIGGLLLRPLTMTAVISYLLVWSFFYMLCLKFTTDKIFVGMWVGLNTGRPIMAVVRRRKNQFQWWYWIFWVGNFGSLLTWLRLNRFPTGSIAELLVVGLMTLVVVALVIARKFSPVATPLRGRLLNEMRSIARTPLPDSNDPALRKWTVEERAPVTLSARSYFERALTLMGRKLGRRWGQLQYRLRGRS